MMNNQKIKKSFGWYYIMMSKNRLENINKICQKYCNMSLSIHEWIDIMKDPQIWDKIHIITEREILMTGHYGSLFNCKIFVSKVVHQGYFRISNKDYPVSPTTKQEDWSSEISLELDANKIEKYLNLAAFW